MPTDTSPGAIYSQLRTRALAVRRADSGIESPPAGAPVWGIVMEMGYPGATATLLTLADGTASIYFSSGRGVIGGHTHETVRRAVATFIHVANQFLQAMSPADRFPVPASGHVTFYVFTDAGLETASALEDDLGHGRHHLSPLFHAGHGVITELRLIDESRESQT